MSWTKKYIFLYVLCCCNAVSQAQTASFTEFLENFVRVETLEDHNGPNVSAHLDYKFTNNLIAQNQLKLHKEGIEDHVTLGLQEDFGQLGAKITYTLHRFDYDGTVDVDDDISLDLSYRALRLHHRYNSTSQVSQIQLPFDLFAATVDLSFSQTVNFESNDIIDVYQVCSQSQRIKVAAAWKTSRETSATEVTTEYQPYESWLMKVSYVDDGITLLRLFSSEFTTHEYRIAGEYQYHKDELNTTSTRGIISVEKHTALAALKLRFEYDDAAAASAVFLEVTSDEIF